MSNGGIFRKEVANSESEIFVAGETLLIQPVSFQVYTILVVLVVTSIILFLFLAEFTKTEKAIGHLEPQGGVLDIYAPSVSYIENIHVSEGDVVFERDPLFSLNSNRVNSSKIEFLDSLIQSTDHSINRVSEAISERQKIYPISKDILLENISSLQKKISSINSRIDLHSSTVKTLEDEKNVLKELRGKGFVSETLFLEKQRELIQARQHKIALSQEKSDLVSSVILNEKEIQLLPLENNAAITALMTELQDLNSRKIELMSQKSFTILAPDVGRVANIFGKKGDLTSQLNPIMTIIPEADELSASLYLSSRARGFVEEGMTVYLQYQAYPFQQFGAHVGTIESISEAVVQPQDIKFSLPIREPVYKVKVSLPSQEISAFGEHRPLKMGMLLNAEIVIDKRTVFQWLMEPVYSLKGY